MPTKLAALAAYLIGVGGAALFFAWILATGVGLLPRADDAPGGALPWVVNIGLLLLFAAQHSGMARQSFKVWSARWVPPTLERALYVAASGGAILLLTLCWQPLPGAPIWDGPLWIAAISLLAALGLTCCCARFDHLRFLGLAQAWTADTQTRAPLQIDGPYRYVRHPLMLGVLIALWAQPIMPPELLLMNVGWTAYILIAIRLEERDLIRQYGIAYHRYRRRVPALVPFLNRIR